jgi:hypothetical protein
MEIDEMLVQIKVQNLCIAGWTIIDKKQLTNINLGSEKKTCNRLKIILIWNLLLIIN